MNALIVEDEVSLATEIVDFLRKENYICDVVHSGLEASEMIAVNLYDFVLLDLGLPDYEGLDLIDEIKNSESDAAIIVITARGDIDDRVKGLNLGADDYLAKPFALVELLSRMKAVGRRKFKLESPLIHFGEFEMDMNARILKCGQNEVDITKKQFDLLQYLVLNRNKALSRIQLYEHIWGNILDDQYDSNFIDVHIKNLRKKLVGYAPVDWLVTVRGVGYKAEF
ncbi:response regulator transcription factor [Natronoflexus pectinivorans]|uniref:DNA-binding response OmpR family regulator n=1 Tax=Natronoflexus pectinivorans TaxID=682526 RepID=A0A4R2GFT4_9BACT|nr:response regulator transcription factor [Natronoflexus pectinivorans]TCO07052.1 DNA-binding response OmpR family regulator [Natronoflexus pectinivorans]